MLNSVIPIVNVPEKVPAETLREDIGELIKSSGGRIRISTDGEYSTDVYHISALTTLIVFTNDSKHVNPDISLLNKSDIKINAAVCLISPIQDEFYDTLFNKLNDFSKRYN